MSRTQWAGAGVVRLLALVSLVLGLLAMHGAAGAHHATAGLPVAVPAAAAEDVHAGTHALTGASGSAVPVCDDDCAADLSVLCVAVLVVAAGLTALASAAARRRPLSTAPRPDLRARAPAAALRSPPSRDPVAELCTSRT